MQLYFKKNPDKRDSGENMIYKLVIKTKRFEMELY